MKILHLVTNAHSNATSKYSSKNTDGTRTRSPWRLAWQCDSSKARSVTLLPQATQHSKRGPAVKTLCWSKRGQVRERACEWTDTSSTASRDWRHYLSVQRTAKGQLLARAGPPHFPEAAAWVIEPHVRTYSTPSNTEKCHVIQMEPGNLDRAGTASASLVTLGNKSTPLIFSIHKIKGMKQCF